MNSDILVSSQSGITTLRFNRPEKKNAITSAMYSDLADGMDAARDDPSTRVVIILGSEDIFTAGNDLKDFLETPPQRGDQPVFRFLRALSSFPKPVIAGVSGPAVGIGTTLLLHCDLVLATTEASFSMPFVDLALVPEAASSLLLPKLIGPHRAARHLLLGEPFDAATALDYGLLSGIVPAEKLEEEVRKMAAALAAKPPEAVRITKALLRQPDEPVAARIEREGQAFAERLQSGEAKEAFLAFFEKRPPNFG